jgi:hypothetical protein
MTGLDEKKRVENVKRSWALWRFSQCDVEEYKNGTDWILRDSLLKNHRWILFIYQTIKGSLSLSVQPSLSCVTRRVHHHRNWIEIRVRKTRDELEAAKGRSGNEFSGSITTRTREANGLHPSEQKDRYKKRTRKKFWESTQTNKVGSDRCVGEFDNLLLLLLPLNWKVG